MKNQKFIISFILGLILLIPVKTFSQNQSLFEITNEKELLLTNEHSQKLEKLKKNKLYKSIELIKLGNVSKISKTNNGALPIKIPGITKSYVAKPVEIEYSSEENFIWKGEFKKDDGYIKLICKNGEIFGNIQINNRFFEIQSFEPGKNVIIEYNEKELAEMTCGNNHEEPNTTESVSGGKMLKSATTTTTRATVRVLALFTDAAQAAVTNINNTASLAISQMNDAISNSEVNYSLVMTLASVQRLVFTENPNDIYGDVNSLSINATAANLRNTNEADIVILLTDGNYTDGYYSYYGIVDNIGPNNADAYAIVEADAATSSRYTFAHEACHLFGGRHDNDPSGTYEHGYEFLTGIWPFRTERHTVMCTVSDEPRIMYYSNPDVDYKNKATGTSTSNDVARKLEIEASTVEGFRSFNPPLSVYISGPTKGNNSGTYTWYAIASGGITPYSYSWNYSLDGYSYSPTISQSSSYTGSLPYNNDLFLRVTVGSSDGQSAVDFHTTINQGIEELLKSTTNSSDIIDTLNIKSEAISNLSTEFTIYPNPTTNFSTIIYNVNKDGLVSLEILDVNGRKIKTLLNSKQEKGRYSFEFDMTNCESGIYLCKLSINGQVYSNKFIVR
ncbi:MAG: hypothetical protein CO129_09905 [Ignavibacteriales bacterium CG_4_9_14_3_um_filter_34_10]|nr:MAG: hypothetical protein CO129_09905 [Ignavibacteriales bacterium CG_4_9_14_3_um_filter_34_10]